MKGDNVVVLTSGEGSTGGAIVILGKKKEAVDSYVNKTKELFPGIKGGGKGERWQGKISEWKNGDIEKLRGVI